MTALRTLDATGIGPVFIDFRLCEVRWVSNPNVSIPFNILAEETKKEIRGVRAEFGPNEYIEGLDD